jgi:nitrite reductase/ring-hydroxylating ferredoxin subunit
VNAGQTVYVCVVATIVDVGVCVQAPRYLGGIDFVGTLEQRFALTESDGLVIVPGERYTSQEFFDLEMERLWSRVWQIACREEELPNPGDFVEYTIGDKSILVVRSDANTINAFFNACPHRGTRLASGVGSFATSQIRCPYHAWRWDFDGEIVEVVDRHDYPVTMTDDLVCLGSVQVGRWGGFVFINMDPECESLESFLGEIPQRYASYRFDELRFRSYRTILFNSNWKTTVDSFNEGYHPQGLHPQMLTWFDDSNFEYVQFGQHSGYGSRERRQKMRPSPRLGLGPEDYDERELVAAQLDAIRGLFTREDQAALSTMLKEGPPTGKDTMDVVNDMLIKAMRERYDLEGLTDDEVLTGGTIHIFPNLVGPLNPGNATLYRVRPYGLDPDRSIMDYWALEWVPKGGQPRPIERKLYDDWSIKDWGEINNQDFGNFAEVTKGMHSGGFRGSVLNPVQEANLIHYQQVVDHYVSS